MDCFLERSSRFSANPLKDVKCSRGHEMLPYQTTNSGFTCDNCCKKFSKDTTGYGCDDCNYDLCQSCSSATIKELPTLLKPQYQISQKKAKKAAEEPKTVKTHIAAEALDKARLEKEDQRLRAQKTQLSAFHFRWEAFDALFDDRLQKISTTWKHPAEDANEEAAKKATDALAKGIDLDAEALAEMASKFEVHIRESSQLLGVCLKAEPLSTKVFGLRVIGFKDGQRATLMNGIREGDVLFSVDGMTFSDPRDFIASLKSGPYTLRVIRRGLIDESRANGSGQQPLTGYLKWSEPQRTSSL